MKHLLSITDLTKEEILKVISIAQELKEKQILSGKTPELLKNKTLAMIFEKPSLRTRLSFEISMSQLGGHAINLGPQDIGLGTREPIKDVAKVTSSMANMIMARTFNHSTIEELAKYSTAPVINGLSDLEHPCQILADLLTIYEQKKTFKNIKIAFIGDGNNNVTHSLVLASGILGIDCSVSSPTGYLMNKDILKKAKEFAKKTGSVIEESVDPKTTVQNADIVYTDTWVSMGNESEKEERLKTFKPYKVDSKLMTFAKKEALFMHDMPAYRGNEVSEEVIDGKQSIVYQQAENRLHAQKALLIYLYQKNSLN